MKIIDVRTKGEHKAGHIDVVTLHDIQEMMQGVYLNIDKNESITVYCESGNRSMMAKSFMGQTGFINVTDGGGIYELAQSLK
jgi:rhodanese-related sulfurtransferase